MLDKTTFISIEQRLHILYRSFMTMVILFCIHVHDCEGFPYTFVHCTCFNEMRRKEERSTCTIMLMRDEKEGRKKHMYMLMRDAEGRKKEASEVKQTNKAKVNIILASSKM